MVRVNPDICPWRENIAVKRLRHDQCRQLNLACKILYDVTSLWSPIHYNLKCILWLIHRHYIHIYILYHVVSALLANVNYLTLVFPIIWSCLGTLPTLSTAALQHKDEVKMSNWDHNCSTLHHFLCVCRVMQNLDNQMFSVLHLCIASAFTYKIRPCSIPSFWIFTSTIHYFLMWLNGKCALNRWIPILGIVVLVIVVFFLKIQHKSIVVH